MTAVDQFQAETEAVATATEREVVGIYTQLAAGLIAREAAVLLIAAAVNRANAVAVTLGDVWLAVQIEELAGQPVPTVGIAPRDHSERLAKPPTPSFRRRHRRQPVTTDVDDDTRRPPGVDPLGTRRTAGDRATGRTRRHDAMQAQPLVKGWTRQMDADPCQLCQWWWRNGRIWPKEHPFQHHKGCNCQPKIVLAEHIQSTQITRRLERNAS